MRIQHNIMAMNAYRNYTNNTNALSGNLEKLSSGYKINRAGDDAAGLAISEKMRAQITGLEAAQKNVKDGISLVKTGEGAMQEIQDMLNRMDYLATQSANGTYDNEVDRANLQKEVDSLKSEINRIADSANFNGIKLLDGSLAAKGSTDVKVKGVDYTVVNAVAGKVTTTDAFANGATTVTTEGNTFTYSVGLSDGTSINVTLKTQLDPNDATGKKGQIVGEDGTVYGTVGSLAGTGFTAADIQGAMLKALKANDTLSSQFKIDGAAGAYSFENIESGKTGVTQITSLGWEVRDANGAIDKNSTGETIDQNASDKGFAIKSSDITLYNGSNYDDAVFTINGKKFVVLTDGKAGANLGVDSANMNATYGLGADVTILVAGDATNKGLNAGDANFTQNIAKIKDVTGLDVRASAAAVNNNNDIGANAGIVISASGAKGGLTLQIGDTADSYNQMKVAIGDMHTKAMGIDKISIADQESAAAAIDKIKSAINYVSGVRGDLGAVQNRLEHTQNNLSVMAENIQDAESTIRDTDVAEEMMSYVKNNILVQSAQAMLAQANQVPQGVLQLLG